jgi:thymidylate synthase
MKQYLDLLQRILDEGCEKESGRPNMPHVWGIEDGDIKMDLRDGFPLLTTKKMPWKMIVHELLWFLHGETNIKYLVDNGVNIWNGDAFRFFQERLWLLPGIKNITMEEFLHRVNQEKVEEKFHYKYGDLGPVYGHSWRNYNGTVSYFNIGKKPNIDTSNHKTAGIGNKGKIKGVKKHPLYLTWSNMINRCYNYNDPGFPKYGGKGVYVSDDWLFFDIFKEDVKNILNYDLKEKYPDDYQLDKDFLGKKYYSKETCVWLNIKENASMHTNNIIYVISNGVETITTDNIEGTAKKIDVEPSNLNRVCNEIRKSVDGWFLVSKKDNNNGTDQIKDIIDGLKTNPYSRYHILDGWNSSQRKISALPPCHLLYQFIVRPLSKEEILFYINSHCLMYDEHPWNISVFDNPNTMENMIEQNDVPRFYLNLNMYQRSCDTFLGVPFNIASMSLLLIIIAKVCNMIPRQSKWIGGDIHLYLDHIPIIKEQLGREPKRLPQLIIKKDIKTLDDILKLTIDDFELKNYESYSQLKGELFTGLKDSNILINK